MKTAEDFIYSCTNENQKEILQYLHDYFLSFPEVEDKIRFKIPFYFRKSWICYLNPIKNDGIELAFTRGNELSNDQGLLLDKGRKQIRGIEFFSRKDIPIEIVGEIFQEALILDETIPYTSKRKPKQ